MERAVQLVKSKPEFHTQRLAMKLTISVIKADTGSIGGHVAPSKRLVRAVSDHGRCVVMRSWPNSSRVFLWWLLNRFA